MHMRNKQYRTCRSQKSQRLVIFLRRCMLGYVEGYDVGLKQVFGFNVSYSIDFLLRQSSVDAE